MGFNALFHGSSPGCNILLATNCSCRRGWIPQMLQKVRYLLAEAATHQDVVFFMIFLCQVGVQLHRVAGLVSSEIDKKNLTSSYIVVCLCKNIFWSFPNRPFSIFSVIFQENIELRQVIVDECGTSPEPEVCQAIFRNLTRVSGIICWYLLYLERWGGFLYCRFSIKVQNKTFQSPYCN